MESGLDFDHHHFPVPLMSWDNICYPKCEAGPGIRRSQNVNAPLLAKLGWKIVHDLDEFWVKLISCKTASQC